MGAMLSGSIISLQQQRYTSKVVTHETLWKRRAVEDRADAFTIKR